MLKKYWEAGFSVIPVNGKRAFLDNWAQYCKRLPTEQEIDAWEAQYPFPKYGVGICCGPASNIMIIDWDTESADIKMLVPYSPVVRYGAKGGASIFKYNPNIPSRKVNRDNLGSNRHVRKHEGIEIMTTGQQVVLPPSIHPDTGNAYRWLTPDTLENFSVEDLPELSKDDVDELVSHIQSFPCTNESGERINGGVETSSRNGRLTQIICAIIANCPYKTDEEIAKEIYEHDEREFGDKAYFKAKDRQHNKRARGNASLAALYFTREHRKRMVRNGLAEPYTPIPVVNVDDIPKRQTTEIKPFPESNGLIYAIQQAILSVSRSKQDELAMGGAIAICSALTSNRFHIAGQPAITHQYIMNVARSGQGKGAALSIANKMFSPSGLQNYNLMGLRNYSSIAAFVSPLKTQRSRIDMIDEFGTVLRGLANGSDLKKELEGILCELYTNDGSYWQGHTTKTDGAQGACYSPAITILGNIQEDTLINVATKSMIESGLLSRFLYFSANRESEFNGSYRGGIDMTVISNECARIFPFYKMENVLPDGSIIEDLGKVEPYREPLCWGVGVEDYKTAIDRELYRKEQELESSGDVTGAIFISRRLQMAERLAITNAVCCDRRDISKKDLDYGLAVVEAASQRSDYFLRSIGSDNALEKKMKWAVKFIRSRGGTVKHREMLMYSHMESGAFRKMMHTLTETGQVRQLCADQKSITYTV
jgi:hypothetical protein